jgi:hypothetical protein
MTKVRDSINRGNLNNLADLVRVFKGGNILSGLRRTIRAQDATVVTDTIVLPSLLKAQRIISGHARVGTAAVGALAVDAIIPSAGTTRVGRFANGDISLFAGDDYTSVDVEYEPYTNVDEVVLTRFPVAANVLTLPDVAVPAVLLCTVTGYTAAGVAVPMTILVPGAGPAATQCRLDASLATILFNAADTVVTADVTMLVDSTEPGALLEAETTFL